MVNLWLCWMSMTNTFCHTPRFFFSLGLLSMELPHSMCFQTCFIVCSNGQLENIHFCKEKCTSSLGRVWIIKQLFSFELVNEFQVEKNGQLFLVQANNQAKWNKKYFSPSGLSKFLDLLQLEPEEYLKCPFDDGNGCEAYIADGKKNPKFCFMVLSVSRSWVDDLFALSENL